MLQKRNGHVRSIDIVNELEFTKPSVSVAMKKLRENGYIAMDSDGHITLLAPDYSGTGRSLIRQRAELKDAATGKLLATGSGSWMPL